MDGLYEKEESGILFVELFQNYNPKKPQSQKISSMSMGIFFSLESKLLYE